nr:MAG TPA: hypothetical protein [Caudoviricetes sp.]
MRPWRSLSCRPDRPGHPGHRSTLHPCRASYRLLSAVRAEPLPETGPALRDLST